jgi:hypothetical protein
MAVTPAPAKAQGFALDLACYWLKGQKDGHPLFDDLLLPGFRFNLLTSTPLAVLPFPLALNSWCVRTSSYF